MTMKKVYEEAVQKIQAGGKYTLFGYNSFGFPVIMHTTIHKAYIGSYAQYNHTLVIEHQPKRKRTVYKQHLLPDETFILWEGWLNIDNSDFWKTERQEEVTVRKSRLAFDNQYIREKLQNVKVKPIAILDRDYHINVNKIEFIYQVVTEDGSEYYTFDELFSKYNFVDLNKRGRIELHNQPCIAGLIGPMWGGYEDGKAVIRYETQEMYQLMSN
jgi:hypothetical protein